MNKPFTIVGAGGAIAENLVRVLKKHNEPVRLVSRSGAFFPECEIVKADALNLQDLRKAIRGSRVVFIVIGLEYKLKVWQKYWPLIMNNIIESCASESVPVVFFDNVYMYGKVEGEMTESCPFNPVSKKGEVRAAIAKQFINAYESGKIKGLIARSADFYGPYAEKTGFFHLMVLKNLLQRKSPQWMINSNLPHSLTFTGDAARALYLLACDDSVWNQTWHLPTRSPALTGNELMLIASELCQSKKKPMVLGRMLLQLLGLFIPAIKESMEMLYQLEYSYIFNSDKFNRHFGNISISYEEGIRQSLDHIKTNS